MNSEIKSALSLGDAIREGYLKKPRARMVIGQNESITYADAFQRMHAMACMLQRECGIGVGDGVMLCAPNTSMFVVVLAAAEMCGARVSLVSSDVSDENMQRLLSLLNPAVVVADSESQQRLAERASSVRRVFRFDASAPREHSVGRATARGDGACFEAAARGGEAELVLMTSGSTGTPKAIVNSFSSFARNASRLADRLAVTPDDVVYVPVPLSHVYGIMGVYTALLAMGTMVTCAKYRAETSLDLLYSTHASVYFGVHTMYARELRLQKTLATPAPSSLRCGLVAGSACPPALFSEYERCFGCTLVQSYGMTETAATLTLSYPDASVDIRSRFVGFPTQGSQVVADPETGEMLCKTPSLMRSRIDEEGEHAPDLDEDGWFHTGDIGAFDPEGGWRIVGRIKDVIIRGGINIFPAEVEAAYQGHPNVSESCLVGYPDSDLGERTCLCVIPAGDDVPSSLELRSFAAGRVEKCKIPDIILKMKEFPRLSNGKVDKRALRARVSATVCG